MQKQFVTYEIALKFKELGYDDPCFKVYDEKGFLQDEDVMDALKLIKVLAPLWQQAIDFLREKCIRVVLLQRSLCTGITNKWAFYYTIYSGDGIDSSPFCSGDFNTFKISREQAILKALEIVKNNK